MSLVPLDPPIMRSGVFVEGTAVDVVEVLGAGVLGGAFPALADVEGTDSGVG